MKKLIYGAALVLALGAASCGQKDGGNDAKYFSEQATDSLLTSFGTTAGYSLNGQITNAMAHDSTITKETFMKGLQYAMAADTSEAYVNGIITGLQIQRQLKTFRSMGINPDVSVVVNSFKKALLADSVPSAIELAAIENQYRTLLDSLQRAKDNYERAKLLETPEAKENAERGNTYIKAQKANNDSVQISASGLGYKIINAGTGAKADPSGRVVLKYTAKTVGGKVVDSVDGIPLYLAGRVEGLKEGVSMLGKGGKAVLYVPGSLAYGVDVPGYMDLGLNELLIYEVEVIDVPETPQAPAAK